MRRPALKLASAVGLAGLLSALYDPPAIGRAGVFLAVLLLETMALLGWTAHRLLARPTAPTTFDGRPADGLVPLIGLPGLEARTNEANPEIGSYLRMSVDRGPVRPQKSPSGSALLGRVGVFSIFVGRDGSSWTDREVAEAFASTVRMGRWLEAEAMRWGAAVNLEVVGTYFEADDAEPEVVELVPSLDAYETVIDEADADVRGLASASRAAARLGFSGLADLIARADPLADHDRTVWFVHLFRAGRSSAVVADRNLVPGGGLALCYARESSGSEPLVGVPFVDPVTLAHELLHLFGASDKYGVRLAEFPPGQVTSRDVMRLHFDRLGQLRVDPLTAAEIGWT